MNTIKRTVSMEQLISRVEGLFPYIEKNEYGVMELHKATDSVDGCYGRIVPDLNMDGKFYSFRYLMDWYYRVKGTENEDESIVSFIEDGIGYIKVPENIKGSLVPVGLYLTEIRQWYDWFQKVYPSCNGSTLESIETMTKDDCCLCREYIDKGGDAMYTFLDDNIKNVDTIATDYYKLALKGGKFQGHIPIMVNLTQSYDDLGMMTPYLDNWVGGRYYRFGEKVLYDGKVYKCTTENFGYFYAEMETILFEYNLEERYGIKGVPDKWELCETKTTTTEVDDVEVLKGITDSKLVSLRRSVRYGKDGVTPVPSRTDDYDWCCLYEVGRITNIQTMVDENGNICYYDEWGNVDSDNIKTYIFEGEEKTVNEVYLKSLVAFGDVLEKIEINDDKTSITFTYCIGAHLIGKKAGSDSEEKVFSMENFTLDNDHYGVRYKETYTLDERWDDYDVESNPIENKGKIGLFTKVNSTMYTESDYVQGGVIYPCVYSNFEASITGMKQMDTNAFRDDNLLGISFKPVVKADIFIERGINAAFERHLKLSEIKTLDDLVDYGNGYYNIVSDNQ